MASRHNIAESALSELRNIERVINALYVNWEDNPKMLKIREEIEEMRTNYQISYNDEFMQMACKLGNVYNMIMHYRNRLLLRDPTSHVVTYNERAEAKNALWDYVYDAFHLKKIPKGTVMETMLLLVKEELREERRANV